MQQLVTEPEFTQYQRYWPQVPSPDQARTEGVEWRMRQGHFTISRHASDDDRAKVAVEYVNKFLSLEAREGWERLGDPLIAKMEIVDEALEGPTRFSSQGGLWHPFQKFWQHRVSAGHPWVQPGRDLYVIWCPMWHKPFEDIKIEIPDEIVEEKGLPEGFELI